MKKLIMLAGAAALASTTAMAAKPDHAQGKTHAGHTTGKHKSAKAHKAAGKSDRGIVTDARNGRLYALGARGSCPPGLAKKNNGCMAPGQAKKQYNVGQRYNRNGGNLWSYNQIPEALRTQYSLNDADRYYYNNGFLYQVDSRSSLVERVISTILR